MKLVHLHAYTWLREEAQIEAFITSHKTRQCHESLKNLILDYDWLQKGRSIMQQLHKIKEKIIKFRK